MGTTNVGAPAGPSHAQAATDITSGSLDGDRLPALAAAKRGGAPVTGTPASKYLRDDDTWATPPYVGQTVEAVAAGPHTVDAAESGRVFTNEGAGAEVAHTLPTAAANLVYEFIAQAAKSLKILANTGDTIRVGDQVSKAGGYLASSTVGDHVRLVAINATEWLAAPCTGTWSLETA